MPSGGPGNHVDVNVGVSAPAAETVVATIVANPSAPGIASQPYGSNLLPTIISGVLNVLAGTTTSAVVVRVRQNSLTGAVVGPAAGWTHTLAGGNSASIPFETLDPVGAAQYVVTVAQTGATVNGTILASVDTTVQ